MKGELMYKSLLEMVLLKVFSSKIVITHVSTFNSLVKCDLIEYKFHSGTRKDNVIST